MPSSPGSVGVSSREDEEVDLSSFQGSAARVLQAAVRDLNITNRGVIGGRLVSESLLNPRWDLEVQVPITEEEGDQFLGLLSRDAAERRDDQNEQ